jgi:RimJ/RimL family protein N-acetyltransferase
MSLRLRADVTILPLTPDAAPRMLAWMQAVDVAEAIGLSQVPTMDRTLAWIENAQNGGARAWAVWLGGSHVGNVVLDQFDGRTETARLSIYLGDAGARSQGVGTTAIYRALEQAFPSGHLYKVWLTVHAENAVAIRVYRKLGFQVEGTLRGAFLLNGRRLDALYMGLLASEFHEMRRASEANRP